MKSLHLTFLIIGFLSVFLVSCSQTPEAQATRDWSIRFTQEAAWSQTIEAGGGVSPFKDNNPEPTSTPTSAIPTQLPVVKTQDVHSPSAPPQTTLFCPACQLVEVTGVVDGDTIDTSIGRVRFFGVDTPERGEECFTEATEFTRLLVGNQVRIEDGPRIEDAYKRRLAYVFDTSGNSLDVQLIEAGFARAWTRDGQHRDTLVELEKVAASNEVGCLWGEFVSAPPPPSTRVVAVPTPTVVAAYQPVEIDFLRAWGAREPWIPLPASRSFSASIDETEVVFRLYAAIWVTEVSAANGALTRESFINFVSGTPLDVSVRSREALLQLLKHPKGVLDIAPWMYEPRSSWEATLGCGLAYIEGRKRYGASMEFLGTMVEYCEQGFTPWVTYLSLSEAERDRDWIEYVASQAAGIN